MGGTNLVSMSILVDNLAFFNKQARIQASKYHLGVDDVISHAMEFVCKYNYKEGKCSKLYYIKKMVCYATQDLYKKLYPKIKVNQEFVPRIIDLDYEHEYIEEGFVVKEAYLTFKECLVELITTDFIAFNGLKAMLQNALKNPLTICVTDVGIAPELKQELYSCIKTCKMSIEDILKLMVEIESTNIVSAI